MRRPRWADGKEYVNHPQLLLGRFEIVAQVALNAQKFTRYRELVIVQVILNECESTVQADFHSRSALIFFVISNLTNYTRIESETATSVPSFDQRTEEIRPS